MLEKRKTVFTYIRYNVDQIQNDLTLMFAGEKIPSGIQEYAATAQELKTKEEIYSAMRFQGKTAERKEYTGHILAVGISYNSKTKEHECKIEQL